MIPKVLTIAASTEKDEKNNRNKVKVEAKLESHGLRCPAPPTPREASTPREYLYAKSMVWTVREG